MKRIRSFLNRLVETRFTNPNLYKFAKIVTNVIFRIINLSYIVLLFISFAIGFYSSGKASTIQHTGIATLSDFEQPDFNEKYFLSNYSVNRTYSYIDDKHLVVTVQNKYGREIDARTWLEVPDFVSVNCEVSDPTAKYDTCGRYILPQHKQLSFNVTIRDTNNNTAQFCLVTESWNKWNFLMWRFINDKRDCISVNINKGG